MNNTNEMQIFENAEFGRIEMLMIDDKPYFPAVDCADKLGYKRPHDAISRHCKGSVKHGVLTNGGEQEKIYIPEGDLYRLIIRSKLPAAVRFEAWVVDEVLPTIRKYGAYIAEEALQQARESLDYATELFNELSEEQAKNCTLREYTEQIGPKARFYDIVLQSEEPVQVSIIAKDCGMTAAAFNALLHELGVQYKVGQTWLLYSGYANSGLTLSKTYLIDGKIASIHTCWTHRGRVFLYKLLKRHGLLPVAEKTTVKRKRRAKLND